MPAEVLRRRLDSALGPLAPNLVPELQVWLRAGTGLFQDVLATLPCDTDGQVVALWQDQSGRGFDVSQATAVNQPTYRTNLRNGKHGVRFDGLVSPNNDRLNFAGGAFSIFRNRPSGHVLAVLNSTVPGTNMRVVQFETDAATQVRFAIDRDQGGVGTVGVRVRNVADTATYAVNSAAGVVTATSWNLQDALANWVVGQETVWLDNRSVAVRSLDDTGYSEDTASLDACVGSATGNGAAWAGDLLSLVVFAPAPSPTTILRVRKWLAQEYALSLY